MLNQQTIGRAFEFEGVGIHSGVVARVVVSPSEPGAGRVFMTKGVTIPAQVRYVVDTRRSTTLGRDGVTLSTVEHLLSALAGSGVDNCTIAVEGPEIPILDGSALPLIDAIASAGVVAQDAPVRVLRLREPVSVTIGASEMRAEPLDRFLLQITTEFAEWPEGKATITVDSPDGIPAGYVDLIAPARTFAFRREVEMLIGAGLAKGGSLDNALIIEPPDTFSSALRVPDEWCAHKLLDVIGDLALLDARLAMAIYADRPGHGINTALAQNIFAHCHE